MTREDLYYDEYFELWELSSKEIDEFENTVYNQALEDFAEKILNWKAPDEEYRSFKDAVNEVKKRLIK